MDLQRSLRTAFQLFSQEPVTYLLAGLIVSVLGLVTFGILAGPLMGGFVYMALAHLREGKRPALGDLGYGFQRFWELFPYILILLLTMIGFFLLFVPGVVLSTWWMYAIVLMVDRGLGYRDAMRVSHERVSAHQGFFPHLGFILLVFFVPPFVVNILSAIFPLLGLLSFVVFPLQLLALTAAYAEDFADRTQVVEVG